jgi:uncharacterized protein YqeY
MATLKEQIQEQMKTAMKSGDKEKVAFARNLHAAIRKKEIDDKVDLDDAGVQKIVGSLLKQRQESLESFRAGNRADLAEKEEKEMLFLKQFLPAQMSESEIREVVAWAVSESKASSPKDLGAVMKLVVPKTQGKADGKLVNQIVREKLGG